MKKVAVKLILSVFVSALVVFLLFMLVSKSGGNITPAKILECLRHAALPLVAVYGLCQIGQTFLRAVRNRLLLRAGMADGKKDSVPGLGHISLVTFVRGACADMLPGRIGELSYVALLNRGYNIPVSDCMTSLSIGLLFDFAALLIVLGVAVATVSQGLSLVGSAIILVVVCLIGWAGLFHIMPWVANFLSTRSPEPLMRFRICRFRPYAAFVKLISDMSESVRFVTRSGAIWPVLGLSALIRFVKYFGLYFLFVAVTTRMWPLLAEASIPAVLVALISAEGAASLPVPSFMSFGSYEAGGLVALTALGFGMAESMTAMLTMHLISQTIDYSLGGAAFCIFTWIPKTGTEKQTSRPRRRWVIGLIAGFSMIAILIVLGSVMMSSGARKDVGSNASSDVPIGVTVPQTKAGKTVLKNSGFKGKIVWSSNRNGSHDLYLSEYPSGKTTRLTASGFTDTYPRFSPDGRRVAFSRSQIPWVSQRDPLKWDTWIVDLATGKETRIAVNAFTASWEARGNALVYVREGRQVVRQEAAVGGPETVLLQAGQGGMPSDVFFQTPVVGGVDGNLAVTMRGGRQGTWVIGKDAEAKRIGGGCEITWQSPDSATVIWVDHPGKQKNSIFTTDLLVGKASVLLDVSVAYSHEYFPKTSTDGKWLVYGASTGAHEHDIADYEIFLWKIGAPQENIVRMTWHTGNDCWPDVFIDDMGAAKLR